jgi:hypothetical protein
MPSLLALVVEDEGRVDDVVGELASSLVLPVEPSAAAPMYGTTGVEMSRRRGFGARSSSRSVTSWGSSQYRDAGLTAPSLSVKMSL